MNTASRPVKTSVSHPAMSCTVLTFRRETRLGELGKIHPQQIGGERAQMAAELGINASRGARGVGGSAVSPCDRRLTRG
jgi:hypothetical protein